MSKISKLFISAMLVTLPFAAGTSSASPTTPNTTWSWGGLYVNAYVAYSNGDVGASFEKAGTLFTAWNDPNGVNQCPGQPTLRLAPGYVPAPEIQKILLGAALAHKALHVWFEATNGICYIKQVSATM
jgi:hypothetical protein